MELLHVGSTQLDPCTDFFWDAERQAVVELSDLGEGLYLVRASKSYRLIRQDEEGQENWDRNISQMNDYLSDTFSSFSLTVDYCDTVSTEVLDEKQEAGEIVREAQQLRQKAEELADERETLSVSVENGVESLQERMRERYEQVNQEYQRVQQRLDQLLDVAERKKRSVDEWQGNGVSLAYLFTFSTSPEVIHSSEVDEAFSRHIEEAWNLHRRKVRQVLEGPRFKLNTRELDEPRVFNRLEHSSLLNPESFNQLLEQANPSTTESLKQVQKKSAEQYFPVALDDIQVEGSIVQRSKSTPARAVNSVLQSLKSENVAQADSVPNDGPIIGKLSGTEQVVGFDPAELPHYYIMGSTGSGKSYLKRVLLENVASLGYDVLTISPSDREEIGLSLPNPDNKDSTALAADQYWLRRNKLLDKPRDIDRLFNGLNAVTLEGVPEPEKQDFVDEVFSRLGELDRSSKPLFVALEEAHNFNEGEAADAIQGLVREARKFGIHVVIVSQNPTDFSHGHRHVRENTVSLFLRGEYTGYASTFLDDATEITGLDDGEAIIQAPDFSKLRVEVRNTFTDPTSPTKQDIEEIDQRFKKENPSPPKDGSQKYNHDRVQHGSIQSNSSIDLSDDEEKLLRYIKQYIKEHDERPTKSKSYRPDDAPFGSSKTSRLLDQLLEKDVIEVETAERYGNKSQVYSPS